MTREPKVAMAPTRCVGSAAPVRVWSVGRILAFALLAALSAYVCIPIGPVPITLQTLVVLLAGLMLCPLEAAAAMVLYLAIGSVGVPVFAGATAGLSGITAGYLIGFVVAAPLIAWLRGSSSQPGVWRLTLAGALGTALIFVCGVAWIGAVMGGSGRALAVGLYPFVPGAALKLAAAVTLVSGIQAARRVGSPLAAGDRG